MEEWFLAHGCLVASKGKNAQMPLLCKDALHLPSLAWVQASLRPKSARLLLKLSQAFCWSEILNNQMDSE